MEPLIHLPPGLLRRGEGPPTKDVVLAVDGGATKTLAVAWSVRSRRLGVAEAGPSNPDAVGPVQAGAAIRAAIERATAAAGGGDIACAVLGLAGVELAGVERAVALPDADALFVVNDTVTAWAAGTAAAEGVAVIAGTGSNVLGVRADSAAWRTGGWGHVAGDEGSAYWIGLHGIRAALHARDGSGPPTALSNAVTDAYGVPRVEDVAAELYRQPLTKDEIAGFARAVSDAAAAGDAESARILAEAGAHLAHQVCTVVDRLQLHAPLVAKVGSAWRAAEPLNATFDERVRRAAPGARLTRPERPPVEGGLLLAGRVAGAWGAELPGDVLEQLAAA